MKHQIILFNKVVLECIKNDNSSTSKILIPDNQDDKSEIISDIAINIIGNDITKAKEIINCDNI